MSEQVSVTGSTRRGFLRSAAIVGGAVATIAAIGGGPLATVAHAAPGPGPADARSDGAGRSVAIFGAGVAGLTAAHELIERGFEVAVYERKELGGKARTIFSDKGLPGEHGFRFWPGFYRNLTDNMRRTPFPGNPNGCWDNLTRATTYLHSGAGRHDLTIPFPFPVPAIPSPITPQNFIDSVASVFETVFRLPPWEAVFAAQKLGVFVTSCDERKLGQWDNVAWNDYMRADWSSPEYGRFMADGIIRNLAAIKSANASTLSIGIVGEATVWSVLTFGNDEGGSVDRVLNGPTSTRWLDPWVAHLKGLGVQFHVGWELEGFDISGQRVASAQVSTPGGRQSLDADWFISAIPVDKFQPMIDEKMLAADGTLADILQLETDWMNGLQFFLRERAPVTTGHVNYVDSPWALTSISQGQFWKGGLAAYGDGSVQDCLSVIISDWNTPGMFNGKKARDCTPEEISAEAWAQIKAHLNDTDDVLRDGMLHSWMLDPAIEGSGTPAVSNDEPLFIQSPGSWALRPTSATGVENMFLAGDWVKTDVNVTTMEGANEGGRQAVNALLKAAGSAERPCKIEVLAKAPWWEPFKAVDRERYRAGQSNVFDIFDARTP
ncbi:hydroxysqualene dehydroxylase [Tomitella biformata]|uniref:hydroxysqualene dehydroxylase n=1 Tax=Tomitella biformata TaxID=630403 RepID=UPI001F1F2768|nr:FAD-dependent oxidoreductase [Tomitella biformata]